MCCNATVPFEALFCAVFGAVLHVVFSVPYAWMLLHCMCVLVLSICVVCLPHYCVLLMFSGPALLEKVSDVTVGGFIVPQLVGCQWGARSLGYCYCVLVRPRRFYLGLC